MKDLEKRIKVLKLAQEHQMDMLRQGIHSDISYTTYGANDEYWEYNVDYLDDVGTEDIGCCFDENSLESGDPRGYIGSFSVKEQKDPIPSCNFFHFHLAPTYFVSYISLRTWR